MTSQKLNILYGRLSQEDARAGDSNSIDVLTPEIVRLFIARIEVGERTKKYSRYSTQKIRIVYRDIGEWDKVAESEEKPTQYSEIISESA
ncbi:MAG: DUF4368 domain-containing protein [Clostridia bacterium]|nr:DUF4368 domain-containing protein [Clostridia bacterium]